MRRPEPPLFLLEFWVEFFAFFRATIPNFDPTTPQNFPSPRHGSRGASCTPGGRKQIKGNTIENKDKKSKSAHITSNKPQVFYRGTKTKNPHNISKGKGMEGCGLNLGQGCYRFLFSVVLLFRRSQSKATWPFDLKIECWFHLFRLLSQVHRGTAQVPGHRAKGWGVSTPRASKAPGAKHMDSRYGIYFVLLQVHQRG